MGLGGSFPKLMGIQSYSDPVLGHPISGTPGLPFSSLLCFSFCFRDPVDKNDINSYGSYLLYTIFFFFL